MSLRTAMQSARLRDAMAAAAVAGSWPAVVASTLARALLCDGHSFWPVAATAYALSLAATTGVAWRVWPKANGSYGLWTCYGVVAVIPIVSVWILLSTLAKSENRLTAIFLSPLAGLLLLGPFILIFGLVVGFDVALVLRSFRHPRNRWIRFFVALGLHYGVAIALALAWKPWTPLPSFPAA